MFGVIVLGCILLSCSVPLHAVYVCIGVVGFAVVCLFVGVVVGVSVLMVVVVGCVACYRTFVVVIGLPYVDIVDAGVDGWLYVCAARVTVGVVVVVFEFV